MDVADRVLFVRSVLSEAQMHALVTFINQTPPPGLPNGKEAA